MTENQEPESFFAEVVPYAGEPPAAAPTPSLPMARSQTQYMTAVAVQKPRQLNQVVQAVLAEADYAKESFYYSFPMGGKKIEGPSIGLAMAIAREWTNCAVPVEYYEQGGDWVFTAHFVDLEKGFTVSRIFRKKAGKGAFKKLDDDRAEDMTFQAAQSRAIRNVVTAGVPRWLISQAIDRAKEAVLKGIKQMGVAHATELALKFLAGYGVTPEQIEAVLEKAVNTWDAEDLATLRGMASQLKDGQTTAEQLFPPVVKQPEKKKPEPPKEPTPTTKGGMVTAQPKEGEVATNPVAPGGQDIDPTHLQHSEKLGTTVVEPGSEVHPSVYAPEFLTAQDALWKEIVTKGVSIPEMDRYTGVARKDDINPKNISSVTDYVRQWTPPGRGGRKK